MPDFNRIVSIVLILIAVGVIGLFVYRQATVQRFELPRERTSEAAGVKHSIPLDEIVNGGPGKDGIPSIDAPKFISVIQAQKELKADGLGLLVSLEGEDRFYPYQILVWHELVNDVVQGQPILVSFCPLCGSGLVFDRRVNGEAVEFGVSGKLHNSDLLMYDRKTDSLWQQILGEAVVGPMTGTRLTQLEASVIPLNMFAQKFPNGNVLSRQTGFTRNYDRTPYGDYDSNQDIFFPVSKTDARLHPKARIVGISIADKYKAYPEDTLKSKGSITDSFAGREVRLEYRDGLIGVTDLTGKKIVPTYTFWFAWFAFHPDTDLYQ